MYDNLALVIPCMVVQRSGLSDLIHFSEDTPLVTECTETAMMLETVVVY